MATIYAVSRMAGVSLATVSRVINGSPRVREETRQKVMEAIAALNYKPNSAAKSLASSISNCIGLLVPELHGPFYGRMMSEIERTMRKAGRHIIVCAGHSDAKLEQEGLEFLLGRNCDALIVHAEAIKDIDLVSLATGNVPVIIINRRVDIIGQHCVSLDNILGGQLAGDCLLDHGHTKIAAITGPLWKIDAADRLEGLKSSLADRGQDLDQRLTVSGDFRQPGGYECMEELLDRGLEFTAVACGNDEMAAGAIMAIRERGLKPGKDISIIGFDDNETAGVMRPQLTTIRYPIDEMSWMAASLLLHRKHGKGVDRDLLHFRPQLVLRGSVLRLT